jgi:hypothetical protein
LRWFRQELVSRLRDSAAELRDCGSDLERYLDFVPRGVAYLMTAAERAVARDPDLGPLAELIDKLVSHFVPQAMHREPGVAKCVR